MGSGSPADRQREKLVVAARERRRATMRAMLKDGDFRLSRVRGEAEIELEESLRSSAAALLKDRKRKALRANVLLELRDSQLRPSTSDPTEHEATALYLDLRTRTVVAKPKRAQFVPRASAAMALSTDFLRRDDERLRRDQIDAFGMIHDLRQRCKTAVERDRKKRLEEEEKAREARNHRGPRSSGQLWAKTRSSMVGNSLFFSHKKRNARKTEDVANKAGFFEDYQRLRAGDDLGALDEDTVGGVPRAAYIIECLDKRLAPEPFLKHDRANSLDLNLAHFGIGEKRAMALAAGMGAVASRLCSLDVSHNRLSGPSLAKLLTELCKGGPTQLVAFDCSHNTGPVGEVLGDLVRAAPKLETLALAATNASIPSLESVVASLADRHLKCLDLRANGLDDRAGAVLADLIKTSPVSSLDLSWNTLKDSVGLFGESLATNAMLEHLDVSQNGVRDAAAEALAEGIASNRTLETLSLAYNRLTSRTGLVFAFALWTHNVGSPPKTPPGLASLDLSGNAVGRNGARGIYRRRLLGLETKIDLRDCSIGDDQPQDDVETFSIDTVTSPITLNLSRPYDRAIACEIATVVCGDRARLKIGDKTVDGHDTGLVLDDQPYFLPTSGRYLLSYVAPKESFQKRPPLSADEVTHLSHILRENSSAFGLLARDVILTTDQVQTLVDELETEAVDVVCQVWTRITDEENKLALLERNADVATALGRMTCYERFALCEANPTGHWKLNLNQPAHRDVLSRLVDYAAKEAHVDEMAGRESTAQDTEEFSPFRNGALNRVPRVFTEAVLRDALHDRGLVEFDYVSIARPDRDATEPLSYSQVNTLVLSRLQAYMERSFNWKHVLLLLRLATLGTYVKARHVLVIHDVVTKHAPKDDRHSADVVVTLFSRIWDLENLDVVTDQLSCVGLVAKRLGWLNVLNPLKLPSRIALDLRFRDNRKVAHHLLLLGTTETSASSAHVFDEEPDSEITIHSLYERLGSMVRTRFDATLKIQMAGDVAPNWRARIGLLSSFLLGTQPLADDIFEVHKIEERRPSRRPSSEKPLFPRQRER